VSRRAARFVAGAVAALGCGATPEAAPRADGSPSAVQTESVPPAVSVREIAAPMIAADITPPPPLPRVVEPPPGLVDLQRATPSVRLSIGYATAANFTGAPLPGYDVAAAWAHPSLAAALADVDRALQPEGLGILVYDAYRPLRATDAMVAWTRRTHRTDLLRDRYIAARSQHNRGLAVDLTLTVRDTGTPLDMGGAWDTFGPASGAFAATGQAQANRRRLRAAMIRHGFVPHDGEWWHFAIRDAAAPVLDVPYAAPGAP